MRRVVAWAGGITGSGSMVWAGRRPAVGARWSAGRAPAWRTGPVRSVGLTGDMRGMGYMGESGGTVGPMGGMGWGRVRRGRAARTGWLVLMGWERLGVRRLGLLRGPRCIGSGSGRRRGLRRGMGVALRWVGVVRLVMVMGRTAVWVGGVA
ncbi:hypothetical protein Sliba_50930 [Streptomyces nigrescens]|uniref:Uncharacterized protein n=1 Tax=Streptomyces nigrescens TaxID=1920 RepID=A0A640TNF0_STRNI|nr:hypothetical protein Sliba_50930 [Streptomyces libani subsp. libani]GGV94896.1 hypothetical protein GCM10010500_33870 [Streptomyces libani subsp. libani]